MGCSDDGGGWGDMCVGVEILNHCIKPQCGGGEGIPSKGAATAVNLAKMGAADQAGAEEYARHG